MDVSEVGGNRDLAGLCHILPFLDIQRHDLGGQTFSGAGPHSPHPLNVMMKSSTARIAN